MPEESIAAYINNITALIIFTSVILFIFLLTFLLSRFFIYRNKRSDYKIDIKNEELVSSRNNVNNSLEKKSKYLFYLKKDPYLIKNLFIFGLLFIFDIFFIFLITLILNFVQQFQMGRDSFLILGLLFFLIVASVYIVKSKIIS